MEIDNKHIIITGAASGIGRAFLWELLSFQNLTIIVADKDGPALQELLASYPSSSHRIVPYVGDLSKSVNVDALFEMALKEMEQVDIFVANAGFAYYEAFGEVDWRHIQAIFELNVYSPLYTVQKMKAINLNRPHYTLITASAMAKTGIPGYALYGATKAALDRFLDSYRYEDSGTPTLGLVYPIATRTSFFRSAVSASTTQLPVTPWPSQTPQRVARAMIQGIQKNQRFIYPSLLFRLTRFPQLFYEWLLLPYQLYYARELNKWKLNR